MELLFLFQLWQFFLCIHCKTKTKKLRGFYRKIRGFSKFYENQIFLESNFWNFDWVTIEEDIVEFWQFIIFSLLHKSAQLKKIFNFVLVKLKKHGFPRIWQRFKLYSSLYDMPFYNWRFTWYYVYGFPTVCCVCGTPVCRVQLAPDHVFVVYSKPIEIVWQYHLSVYLSYYPIRDMNPSIALSVNGNIYYYWN